MIIQILSQIKIEIPCENMYKNPPLKPFGRIVEKCFGCLCELDNKGHCKNCDITYE